MIEFNLNLCDRLHLRHWILSYLNFVITCGSDLYAYTYREGRSSNRSSVSGNLYLTILGYIAICYTI